VPMNVVGPRIALSPTPGSTPGSSPRRYELEWGAEFWELVRACLRPGIRILDIGAGRRPTIAIGERPERSHYVGLDSSAAELALGNREAGYDETVVADAQEVVPHLVGRFDLIVAWQVFEHFEDVPRAAETLRSYTAEGAALVACLSGRYAAYAIANRLLPDRLGRGLVSRLMRRPIDSVFPAHYDQCTAIGLRRAFAGWVETQVIPLWHGADYFDRFPRIRSAYVRYEDWAIAAGRRNLATHYVVAARRTAGSGSIAT
jgi:SAM-dependent methyltransferase